MSRPREGSREIDEGIIVSEAMDWCNSPTEPVPYRIWAKQIQATNLADSVRQTDDRSHVKGSIVLASYGDEPGVGGGVTSGTTGAECTPKTWSETVRAQGRNMVRHEDDWWMNHENTWGKLCYVKDQSDYLTRDPQTVNPKLQLAFYKGTATDAAAPEALPSSGAAGGGLSGAYSRLGMTLGIASMGYGMGQMGGQYYEGQDGNVAIGITKYQQGQVSPFSPQGQAIGGALGFPSSTSRIDEANNFLSLKAGEPVDFRQMPPDQLDELVRRPWPSPEQINKNKEALDAARKRKKDPKPAPSPDGLRNTGQDEHPRCKCITGSYESIEKRCGPECGSTYEAHHIVPDYTLRYGNRDDAKAGRKRIDGLPDFYKGPAICLQGQARDAGSEHGLAHAADVEVAKLGRTSPIKGTASIIDITSISVLYADLASNSQCSQEIAGALHKQPSLFSNTLGRTTIDPPDPTVPSEQPAYTALGGSPTNYRQ